MTARNRHGSVVSVHTRSHRWIVDEPEHKGGSDLGPTPLESLLGPLAACEAVVLKLVAEAIGFRCSDLEITCEGTADMRGARGVNGVRPYFSDVRRSSRSRPMKKQIDWSFCGAT
ncbi:MAG: OsmC family protein [Pseudomonadota bacterium]